MKRDERKAFTITGGRGFQMRLPNGYIVSIQMGTMNYCDNRELLGSSFAMTKIGEGTENEFSAMTVDFLAGNLGCDTVETAILAPSGKFIRYPDKPGDDAQGWMTSEDVAKLLVFALALPPEPKALPDPDGDVVDGEIVS